MNGLVAAAAEAEAILKRAKWNTQPLDLNNDLDSNDGSLDHNVGAWDTDRQYFSNIGRKRPAEQYSTNNFSQGKREQPSQSTSPVKKKAKFNIHEKLRELYEEFSADEALQTNYQGLKVNSYLLEKLLTRINLNVLIINLYPGNKGYSISLKLNGDTHMLSPPHDGTTNNCRSEETLLETARWPYEEEDLLSYIDNEELPIVLLDLLEAEYSSLFYSGCIIAQIRDYRQGYPSCVCDTHHVLLKPTTQSIISDVNAIARAGSWGREERLLLESAVVLATAPPLCLEPRPAVGLLAARLHHQRHLLATPDIRRQARRYSQVSVNRKRRLDQFTQYRGLSMLDLINKQRGKSSTQRSSSSNTPVPRASSKYPKKPSDVLRAVVAPRIESPPLAPPSDVDNIVARLARAYDRPRNLHDCAPQLIEEYVLETERAPAPSTTVNPNAVPGVFHIKLSILQRPSNQEYLGELYVDRDHVEGERNGSACRFPLGTRAHAHRYIQQFTEIFTEEGRKSVKIKHLVPGQLPRVTFTTGMREMGQAQLAMQARAQSLAAAAAAAAAAQAAPTPLSGNGSSTSVQASAGVGVVPQQGLVGNFKLPPPSPAVPSPTGIVAAPAPSPEVVLIAGPSPAARRTISASLPLLQAQLQAGPQAVQQLQANQAPSGSPVQPVASQLEQSQTLNTIQHLQLHQSGLKHPNNEQLQTVHITTPQTSQIQQIQNAQQAANQLLVQQLTNPPQPINPPKLQSTIIHIPHSLSSQLLQQKVGTSQPQLQTQAQHVTLQAQPGITLQGQPSLTLQGQQSITVQGQQGITLQSQGVALQSQGSLNIVTQQNNVSAPVRPIQKVAPLKQRHTNPAISALVTSLMNSAQQYQQQQQLAAKSTANSVNNSNLGPNSQMLSLLNMDTTALNKTQAGTTTTGIASKKPISQSISNSSGSYSILGSNAQMISLLNSDSSTMIKTPTGVSTVAGIQNKKTSLPTQNSVTSFGVLGPNAQMLSLLNSESSPMNKTSPITGTINKKVNSSTASSSVPNSGVLGANTQMLSLLNSESPAMTKVTAGGSTITGVTVKKTIPSSVSSSAGASGVLGSNVQMLNLLNSESAAMTKTPVASSVASEVTNKKTAQSSALLERLMAPPAPVTQNQNAPQSIDILSQIQNVQLQFPGCTQPLSFSLNVSADGSTRYLVSLSQRAPSTSTKILTVPLNNTIEEKNMHPLQLVTCPRVAPGQVPIEIPVPADTLHYMGNTIQTIVNPERRHSNPSEPNK